MDPLSELKSEIFRPLASVVLPGMLALTPFAVLFANSASEIQQFFEAKTMWFFAAFVGCSTIAGMLLENIGTSIERGIDRCMEVEYMHGHDQIWDDYLKCGVVDNNGRRFLASIVTRLKFINSLMPALIFFSFGMISIELSYKPWSVTAGLVALVLMSVFLLWLFRTSTELSEVASNTRCHLIGKAPPIGFNPNAVTVGRQRHFAYVIGELLTSRVAEIDLNGKSAWSVLIFVPKLWRGKAASSGA